MHCILKHYIMIVHWLCIQYNTENLIRCQSSVARLNGRQHRDTQLGIELWWRWSWWCWHLHVHWMVEHNDIDPEDGWRVVLVLDDNQLRIDLNWLNVAAVVSSRVHLGEQPYEVGWMQFPAPEVIISASQHGSLPNKVHQLLFTGCIFSSKSITTTVHPSRKHDEENFTHW